MFPKSSYGPSVNAIAARLEFYYNAARFALQFGTANFGVGGHEYWIYAGPETRVALRSATLRTPCLYVHFVSTFISSTKTKCKEVREAH